MDIKFADIKNKFGEKAKEYSKDKKKTKKLLDEAIKKAINKESLKEIWDNLQLLFGLVKDWLSGDYKDVPIGSIIAIIIGLLYFVSPIDFVPDFLPGGLVDDALVLGLIIKQVKSDLDKYKEWLDKNESSHIKN